MSSANDEIQIVAYLVARPGQEQALADAVRAIVPAVCEEDGCLTYVAHVDREAPGTVVFYEIWRDQAALDAHAAGPNLRVLAARFDELLAEPLRIETLQRIA